MGKYCASSLAGLFSCSQETEIILKPPHEKKKFVSLF
jgi:hypothetical protein